MLACLATSVSPLCRRLGVSEETIADMETSGRDADLAGCGQTALQFSEEPTLNARGLDEAGDLGRDVDEDAIGERLAVVWLFKGLNPTNDALEGEITL